MRFRSFLDRNHHSEFFNKFVPPFVVAYTYISYIEEYPPPPTGLGGQVFHPRKVALSSPADQHDCDERPPQVDEYNTDSEDNSLEIEDRRHSTSNGYHFRIRKASTSSFLTGCVRFIGRSH